MIHKQFLLPLLILLTLGYAEKDSTLEDFFKEIINGFKEEMPTGMPDIGLPPLEPYQNPNNLTKGKKYNFFGGYSWRLKSLAVYNMSHFQIQRLEIGNLPENATDIKLILRWPVIRTKITYYFILKVLFIYTYFNGRPMFTLENPHLYIRATLKRNGTEVQMQKFEVALHYSDFFVENVGIWGKVGDFFANIVIDLVLKFVSSLVTVQ